MAALMLALGVFLQATSAQAENFKMFWLTETLTGTTTGPILARPGVRFSAVGGNWIILTSKPGEILFSDAETSKRYGPYGFERQRIIDLGKKALIISKIEYFLGANPSDVKPVLSTVPVRRIEEPIPKAEVPQGWDRKPLPSTNPADHLNRPQGFAMQKRIYPTVALAWLEPIHNAKYDWSVGQYAGNSGEDIESTRFGFMGMWKNWFVEGALINAAKTGGPIVPDDTYLSDLGLAGGKGFSVSGGYLYSFVIDGNWNANFGGYAKYESISFDMNATVFTRHGQIIPAGQAGTDADTTGQIPDGTTFTEYSFDRYSETLDMSELSFSALGGIDYTSMYWGVGAYVILDLYTDASFSGSIQLLDEAYDLSADKTHPVGIKVSGWYSPFSDYIITGSFTLATETTIRVGFGKFF